MGYVTVVLYQTSLIEISKQGRFEFTIPKQADQFQNSDSNNSIRDAAIKLVASIDRCWNQVNIIGMMGFCSRMAKIIPSRAKFCGEKKAKKINEHPFIMSKQQLQEALPEEYLSIQKQSQELEQELREDHVWRLKSLEARLSQEDRLRIQSINRILNGLTEEEVEYLKYMLVSPAEHMKTIEKGID